MLSKQAFYPDISPPSARLFSCAGQEEVISVMTLKLCRNTLIRLLVVLAIISSLLNTPAYSQESEDSQIFITGFNAFQQKDYPTTITKMNEVLQKHPDSPLRDMVLFWLSRAHYKNGNQRDAARYLSQFSKEFPDNPLKGTVDEELLALTARYDKGEELPTGSLPVVARKTVLVKERLDPERAAQEKAALQKAEQERITAARAEEGRKAAEATAIARRTVEEAGQARLAAIQREQERDIAIKAETERKAEEKAQQARLAAVQREQERLAATKVEEERKAVETAAIARRTAEEAEQARLAALQKDHELAAAIKAETERKAEEKAQQARLAAAQREQERLAAIKAEEERQVSERATAESVRLSKAVLREKAIAQYKSTIEKYPASKAAATAAAKLKELGVAVALPQAAAVEPIPENAQFLRLEVAAFAGLEFVLAAKPQAYNVSQPVSIPFEITNRGNGSDSFNLESGFPAEFAATFAAASQTDKAVSQTTTLAPGESFKGLINLSIPPASIDGMRISYPVKAASRLLPEATQSREVSITAAAPMLRAIVKTDKLQPVPGEKALYRVTLLNVGSTAAQGVTLRLNYPSQLEPLDFAAAGFRQEMKSVLVLDGVQIKSGESREYSVLFQLQEGSLAGQELLIRAELLNTTLKTASVFVSNAAHVQQQHGVLVRSAPERQVVIPGQAFFVPFVVTNTGNVREKFRITPSVNGAQEVNVFLDLNRDGVRQANEPTITEVGPLAPKEEAGIIMEIKTPRSAADGSQGSAGIVFSSEGDPSRSSSGAVHFVYSRPVLQMDMTARDGKIKPGEVVSFDLTIANRGSNLARVVGLQGTWPEQLELIAADPPSSSAGNGSILWSFKEVGAGEKRTIRVSFRVKPGTVVGTNIQVKNLLSYEDQLGNRY
jgi:hypothetical protein